MPVSTILHSLANGIDHKLRFMMPVIGLEILNQFTVFMPQLLKPAPTRLRLVLWSLANGADEFPESPPPGLVTIPHLKEIPANIYLMSGYKPAGDRAIRIDMLERLADMLQATVIMPYPGTPLFEQVAEKHPEIRDGSSTDLSRLHVEGLFNEYSEPVQVVRELSRHNPTLHHELLNRWQRALSDADAWLTELSTGSARHRVARLILRLSDTGPGQPECRLFSREDLGAMLGITTETASRTIAEFKRNGWLRELATNHFVVDTEALEEQFG